MTDLNGQLNRIESKVDTLAECVARIDERTTRMDTEYNRRLESVHKRIDSVEEEAKAAGTKAGGIIATIIAGIGAYLGIRF